MRTNKYCLHIYFSASCSTQSFVSLKYSMKMLSHRTICFWFLAILVFGKKSALAVKPPAYCVLPANVVPIDLSKFSGVWYQQMLVNYNTKTIPRTCVRFELTVINSTTGVFSRTFYVNGKLQLINRILRKGSGEVITSSFDMGEDITEHKNVLYASEDVAVLTICSYNKQNQLIDQYEEVITRGKTVTRKFLKDLLKKLKVKARKNVIYVDHSKNCYTCKCRSG